VEEERRREPLSKALISFFLRSCQYSVVVRTVRHAWKSLTAVPVTPAELRAFADSYVLVVNLCRAGLTGSRQGRRSQCQKEGEYLVVLTGKLLPEAQLFEPSHSSNLYCVVGL